MYINKDENDHPVAPEAQKSQDTSNLDWRKTGKTEKEGTQASLKFLRAQQSAASENLAGILRFFSLLSVALAGKFVCVASHACRIAP
jgi:hypothetical protein